MPNFSLEVSRGHANYSSDSASESELRDDDRTSEAEQREFREAFVAHRYDNSFREGEQAWAPASSWNLSTLTNKTAALE